MQIKRILKHLVFILLAADLSIITYLSLFFNNLNTYKQNIIIVCGVIFFAFDLIYRKFLTTNHPPVPLIPGEYITKIPVKDFESLLFKSTLRTTRIQIYFYAFNLLLVVINLLLYKGIQWGNLAFAVGLAWLGYGRYETREKLKKSIYWEQPVKHIIKPGSIEIITDTIHHSLSHNDIAIICRNTNWVIFARKKHDDFFIIETRQLVNPLR